MLSVGVGAFVTIDLILLLLNTILDEALGSSSVRLDANRENPRTITGVSNSKDHKAAGL